MEIVTDEFVLSVSELNHSARQLLEQAFTQVQIIGEISNLSRPSSGHLYFTLKDEKAQIRCAFFRMQQRGLNFALENGQQVLVRARVSVYEPRGDYQLIINRMQLGGDGALQIAFDQLKKKLEAEGLFHDAHKQAIPTLPKCIGVITSASGAAVRDILKVLRRRFSAIPIILYPTLVQGAEAASQICRAIQTANERQECDVLLLARGGGSLEDLWPFNEEPVARAIFASDIPIVSGVGHEVDFTIADFVADQRAATPSAAAEWVSPDATQWQRDFHDYYETLTHWMQHQLQQYALRVDYLQKRLRHPGERIEQQMQRLDQLEQALNSAQQHFLKHKQAQLNTLARALDALSPLQTLQRGYAIVQKGEQIIRDADAVQAGDSITAKLADGNIDCIVEHTRR